jgi:hypothetical protein
LESEWRTQGTVQEDENDHGPAIRTPDNLVLMSNTGEVLATSQSKDVDYSEMICVKIQHNPGMDMLVYDKTRSFGCLMIQTDAAGYKEIGEMIVSEGIGSDVTGRKGYFDAYYLKGSRKTRRPKNW